MPSAPLGTPSPSRVVRSRLDSWKEIADYLKKGERTAKRWEKERALPVHHVPGGGHGSVYAFTAELDEWLLSEIPKEANSPGDRAEGSDQDSGPAGNGQGEDLPASQVNSVEGERAGKGFLPLRRILRYAFLTTVAAVVVIYSLNLHTVNAYTSSFVRSLLVMKTARSPAPSAPEKQLAHELYLRGRFEWNRRTADSLNRALDYFTQAVVHDPGNAEAYVGLADTYNLLREYTLMPEEEAYDRAIAAAKKAIELDDSLAEAHRSLAFDEIWGNWDFEAGKREFQRAIELNPRDPIAHFVVCERLRLSGLVSDLPP